MSLQLKIQKVRYLRDSSPILSDISLELKSGQIALLAGATGSGKTTILRCLNGIIPHILPTECDFNALYGGAPLNPNPSERTSNSPSILTLLQNPFHSFLNLSHFPSNPRQENFGDWLIESLQTYRCFHDLSAGERQRLLLQNAFGVQPDILLLDEPTNHLDQKGLQTLETALKKRKASGKGVTVIAEHRFEHFNSLIDVTLNLNGFTSVEAVLPEKFPLFSSNKKTTIISLQKVSYNINGVSLLQDIDLEIPSSQIISITGPNGSGKTTLGKILCGQLKPFKGKVICHNPRVKTAFLFEDPQAQLICDTVQDEVYFAARNFALPREFPDYLLHIFNLQSLQFNSPLHLSHGQQTKTAFAAILSHNPELVILDEPTQGQDPSAIKYLISFLKSLAIAGKAVVILSHNIDFLRLVSNRILVLNGGGLKELC